MVTASAPITGGRLNTNDLLGSARSITLAGVGVMLMFIVIGLGGMLLNLTSGLPVIGRISGVGQQGISGVGQQGSNRIRPGAG